MLKKIFVWFNKSSKCTYLIEESILLVTGESKLWLKLLEKLSRGKKNVCICYMGKQPIRKTIACYMRSAVTRKFWESVLSFKGFCKKKIELHDMALIK